MRSVGEPKIVDLGAAIDLGALGVPRGARLFALLGGYGPSGSIKDAAVALVLDAAVADGALQPGKPVAEISNGSMARSLVWAASRLGSPVYLSFPGASQAKIDGIVGVGKAQLLAFDAPTATGHPIVDFFAGFEAACQARGYFYLDQTRSKVFAPAYQALVPDVLATLARRHDVSKLDSLVCGVGTGSTVVGLGRGVKAASREARVIGVEPAKAPGHAPPWDDLPGLRNTAMFHWDDLGGKVGVDSYLRVEVDSRVEVSMKDAQSAHRRLADAGIVASLAAGAVVAGAASAIAGGGA